MLRCGFSEHTLSRYNKTTVLYRLGETMTDTRLRSFAEFWPYYLGEHRDPRSRALHYLGTTLATGLLLTALISTSAWWILPALVAGYGPAWIGHFFIEHNRPATFRYPLWSLAADYRMAFLALTGELAHDLERLFPRSS